MYYGREEDWESAEMTIDIVNDGAVSTANVYPQPQKTGVLYNAYLIQPKFKSTVCLLHFFATSIFKSIKHKFSYEYKASWDRVSKEKILLPTKDGEIDFEFMENFITELETARIAELEAERIAELEAYLSAAGLKDFVLTDEEQAALERFGTVEWSAFKFDGLFTCLTVRKKLSKAKIDDTSEYPVYSAETSNNGIIGYVNSPEFICDKKNPVYINFGDHTRNFNIATKSFSVLDNVKVLFPKINNIRILQFIIGAWKKQIPNLGYSRHWKLAKESLIPLPVTKDGAPDYEFMEKFVSAVQKIVIADVVKYSEERMSAYRQAANK